MKHSPTQLILNVFFLPQNIALQVSWGIILGNVTLQLEAERRDENIHLEGGLCCLWLPP